MRKRVFLLGVKVVVWCGVVGRMRRSRTERLFCVATMLIPIYI